MTDDETLIQYPMRTRLALSLFKPSEDDIEFYRLLQLLVSRRKAQKERKSKLNTDIKRLEKEIAISNGDFRELKKIAAGKSKNAKLIEGVEAVLYSIDSRD